MTVFLKFHRRFQITTYSLQLSGSLLIRQSHPVFVVMNIKVKQNSLSIQKCKMPIPSANSLQSVHHQQYFIHIFTYLILHLFVKCSGIFIFLVCLNSTFLNLLSHYGLSVHTDNKLSYSRIRQKDGKCYYAEQCTWFHNKTTLTDDTVCFNGLYKKLSQLQKTAL